MCVCVCGETEFINQSKIQRQKNWVKEHKKKKKQSKTQLRDINRARWMKEKKERGETDTNMKRNREGSRHIPRERETDRIN